MVFLTTSMTFSVLESAFRRRMVSFPTSGAYLLFPLTLGLPFTESVYGRCRRTTCPPGPAVPPDQLSPRTCGPRTSCPPGPAVPPDQLSPRTCGPRTSCPPGRVVLGLNVPCQDRMSPHCEVPASLSSDGKLRVGPENKAG